MAQPNSPSGTEHDPLEVGELQKVLLTTGTIEEFLTELASRAAARTGYSCGITVRGSGNRPYTVASSDDLALRLDELQYAGGTGPCLQALHSGVPVFVTDMAAEQRWGEYGRWAADLGAVSSRSFPMSNGEQAVGALNLYATLDSDPATGSDDVPARLADRAAGAVALAIRLSELAESNASLQVALTSRSVIDQAIGVMMGQQRCTAAEAFALIVKTSQRRNIKVRDIAGDIIAGIERRGTGRY